MLDVIHKIGLSRAISTHSVSKDITESQCVVLESAEYFGVDYVYFNTDDNSNSFPAIFIKEVNTFDVDNLMKIAETQRKTWNYKKVIFLYVYSETEIRIYNCSDKPIIKTQSNIDYELELRRLEISRYQFSDNHQLEELNKLFSTIAIDSGIIWTLEEADFVRRKITLQQRVDKYLVESLVNTATKLEEQGLKIEYIHKIILRSLFLLYLEDRGATDGQFYSLINEGANSYFDILNNVNATFNLFQRLEQHFNGNVFTLDSDEQVTNDQLQLIKKCFISGNDNTPQVSLFQDWRIFDFSIIQIELLSEIYENFLFKTDPVLKKKTGTYYTPPSLVEFILNEKLSVNNGETEYNVKILDPSCGSGIFLVESFKRLVKRYENIHKQKLTDFDTLKKLLTDNIYGIELHPPAIKVAAFSLYLALVDNLNPKNIWQNKNHQLPNLINNPDDLSLKEQGYNLFCRDTISNNAEIESIEFDLVVGNPPFGTSDLIESIANYCKKENFAKEMVLPFLHKATLFAPKGKIALIFNTKVLTNTGGTYQNFRKWLFNECYVEKVYNFSILRNAKKNFGGQLFGDATGPISIVYFQKEQPENPSDKIVYYAPKTYIKSNVIEGLNIDFTDVKYLPRTECQKPDTKIWKIAMWGGISDWELIKFLDKKKNLGDFLSIIKAKKGLGLQFLDNSTKSPIIDNDIPQKFVKPHSIRRYNDVVFSNLIEGVSDNSKRIYESFYESKIESISSINAFRRVGTKEAFEAPHILIKEGLTNWMICSAYVDKECSFNSKVIGIHHDDPELLKGLVCYINSQLAQYYIFLTSASIGIEREEIKPNELFKLPLVLTNDEFYTLAKIYDNHFSEDKFYYQKTKITEFEKEVNKFIISRLLSNYKDTFIIDDFVLYTLPMLKKNINLITLQSRKEDILLYSQTIINELNCFLKSQNIFTNVTTFNISKFNPLMLIKLSFSDTQLQVFESIECVDEELKKIDFFLWEQSANNIYFRKKLNYKTENDIYIIRPNQRRFWSRSMALEDATELILEILNGN